MPLQGFAGLARRPLELLPWPGAGVVHGLLASLQVIQQRAVGVGEFTAVVLARLEQAGGSPAMQGALTDAEAVGCLALNAPAGGASHPIRRKGQMTPQAVVSAIDLPETGRPTGGQQVSRVATSQRRLLGLPLTRFARSGLRRTVF